MIKTCLVALCALVTTTFAETDFVGFLQGDDLTRNDRALANISSDLPPIRFSISTIEPVDTTRKTLPFADVYFENLAKRLRGTFRVYGEISEHELPYLSSDASEFDPISSDMVSALWRTAVQKYDVPNQIQQGLNDLQDKVRYEKRQNRFLYGGGAELTSDWHISTTLNGGLYVGKTLVKLKAGVLADTYISGAPEMIIDLRISTNF